MEKDRYKIWIIRGSLQNPQMLDNLGSEVVKKLDRPEWQSLKKVVVDREQLQSLQQSMTRHYDDSTMPWYVDGHKIDSSKSAIVAFGADDGEGGRVFEYIKGGARTTIDAVINYGVSKGIPREVFDYMK